MQRAHEDEARRPEGASGHRSRIFTVPAGQPFLLALARAILAGDLPVAGGKPPDALTLPRYTLLLPTRRAARALSDAFLRASGGRALLLPRIRPIAEGEEDLSLLQAAGDPAWQGEDEIPPAVSELERRLVLTRMVMAWSNTQRDAHPPGGDDVEPFAGIGARTPAQAARLAADLARLMDTVETENASLAGLEGLVPESLSEHWRQTVEFLEIVTRTWPAYVQVQRLSSPMERRNRLLLAEASRLQRNPPAAPVIVAGVTGSIPAATELMRAVSQAPQGAIVLPALDQSLDDDAWHSLAGDDAASHPQHGLRKLLDRLEVARSDVQVLPGGALAPARALRNAVVAEAMRPASATARWRAFADRTDRAALSAALAGVSLIVAAREQDEAEAIALILRQALDTPGRTAALVSPDRMLARRVAIRLASWGIRVDDSAGRPFAKTVPGTFLDLVVDAVAADFAPAATMALLKHPLTRLELPIGQMRRAARTLEIAAFRAMYLGRGLDGIDAALERAARESRSGARRERAVRRLWDRDWHAARDLVDRLRKATAALAAHFSASKPVALSVLAAAHIETAEALARPAETDQPSLVWQGEAGEAAASLFARLMDAAMPAPLLLAADYAEFYRSLIAGESVRPRVPVHPRLFIWGPYEARLQQPDVVVLGSLNEGKWPGVADPGAWLNRPMRKALGLPAPEEELGRAAHDFTTFLGADRVLLTRATKVEGAPTVPSRWLMRLCALLDGLGMRHALAPVEPWMAWAQARNMVRTRRPVGAPEPRPPLALRPRRASVSDVEKWITNPYAIFARHMLGLEPLPLLGAEPGPRERGQIVHEALSRFLTRHPDRLPAHIAEELLRAAGEVLSDLAAHPRVAAFWLPRLARFAAWFADTEPARRAGVQRLVAEVAGELVLAAPAGAFTLRARADRLDLVAHGLAITDYKTGVLPTDRAVITNVSPQLPLEAAIAAAGGFAGLAAGPVSMLRYIRATGAEPAGEERVVAAADVDALARDALAGLRRLVARFDNAATPYRAMRRARFKYDYDDYAHLARAAEWAGPRGEEDE